MLQANRHKAQQAQGEGQGCPQAHPHLHPPCGASCPASPARPNPVSVLPLSSAISFSSCVVSHSMFGGCPVRHGLRAVRLTWLTALPHVRPCSLAICAPLLPAPPNAPLLPALQPGSITTRLPTHPPSPPHLHVEPHQPRGAVLVARAHADGKGVVGQEVDLSVRVCVGERTWWNRGSV